MRNVPKTGNTKDVYNVRPILFAADLKHREKLLKKKLLVSPLLCDSNP